MSTRRTLFAIQRTTIGHPNYLVGFAAPRKYTLYHRRVAAIELYAGELPPVLPSRAMRTPDGGRWQRCWSERAGRNLNATGERWWLLPNEGIRVMLSRPCGAHMSV